MKNKLHAPRRKSYMEYGNVYFWTATINSWKHLLRKDEYKEVIIDSWRYLVNNGKIDVFAFVIMPSHLHSIWRLNEPNGKESPQGSFLKHTAHCFQKMLRGNSANELPFFKVNGDNKKYEFWQRDPLAIPLYTRAVARQKLDYMHNNPLAAHWQLVKDPCEYKYSSAKYYEQDKKNFDFLKDLWEVV